MRRKKNVQEGDENLDVGSEYEEKAYALNNGNGDAGGEEDSSDSDDGGDGGSDK